MNRLLKEQALGRDRCRKTRPARSVTVNMAESPLGWLFARGHLTQRQFDAGEQLRRDWERAELAPRVTMSWLHRSPKAVEVLQPVRTRIAPRSMPSAVSTMRSPAPDRGWPTSCGGSSVQARECAMPKRRWAGRRERGSWYSPSRSTGSPLSIEFPSCPCPGLRLLRMARSPSGLSIAAGASL